MANARLPDEIHQAKGTYQPCRHGDKSKKPEFPAIITEPPDWLGELATKEWLRIVPVLADSGMLKQTDFALLTIYCELFGRFQEEKAQVSLKLIQQLISLCTHFGMSPMSRSKIKLPEAAKPEKEQSRWLKIVNTPKSPGSTPKTSSAEN